MGFAGKGILLDMVVNGLTVLCFFCVGYFVRYVGQQIDGLLGILSTD